MKTSDKKKRERLSSGLAIFLTLFIFLVQAARAVDPTPPKGPLLDSWSFLDTSNWTSDLGYAPVSFANLNTSLLGDGYSLMIDTNIPAWLQFNVVENDGTTNLTVDVGSITFWFGPDWASTNAGGTGPGQWAQLIDVGEWTPDSSYGYWGLSVDPPGMNLLFLSQDGLGDTYSLSTPISWTTNYFHFIVLTYSATNVSLYLDGELATNDPGGLSIWPGSNVLSSGLYFGSDTNGLQQAGGLFNSVYTYNIPLYSNTVQRIYNELDYIYVLNPLDSPFMSELSSAPSSPSTSLGTPDVISGPGYLVPDGVATNCSYAGTNYVWITNFTATVSNGTMNVTFSIDGGTNGYYDVFASPSFEVPLANAAWAWMGQGLACNTYTITNISSSDAVFILGTPNDPDNNGLTEAYELLILHCNPFQDDQDGAGISDGWQVLLGLNVLTNQVAQPGTSSTYSYTKADWLSGVSGIKSGSIILDAEGNVTQVSQ